MTETTIIQLSIYQLIGMILLIIGTILIPLIAFLWRVVDKRQDKIDNSLEKMEKKLDSLKEDMIVIKTALEVQGLLTAQQRRGEKHEANT